MPVGEYHTSLEVANFIYTKLTTNKTALGLKYIGFADEKLIPEYPAVIVSAGAKSREIEQTHKFTVRFTADLWILHANLNVGHKVRSQQDMALADAVTALLDSDPTLGGNIVFGYVDSETPGVMARSKGSAVISTRLSWMGVSRQTF